MERTICLKSAHSTESSSRCSSATYGFEWLDQHKDELMANWEKMKKSEPFDKIKPLE